MKQPHNSTTAHVEVTGIDPINTMERQRILQHISDTTSDEELQKLEGLVQSPKARNFLKNNWGIVQNFID